MTSKNKTSFPSKTTINLIIKDSKRASGIKVMVAVLLSLAVLSLFAKFLVLDRFDKVKEAEQRLLAAQQQYNAIRAMNNEYDAVFEEYIKISTRWMTEPEMVIVNRVIIMELITNNVLDYCTVETLAVNGNTLMISVITANLSDLAKLVSLLEDNPYIVSVEPQNAGTQNSNGDITSVLLVTLQPLDTEEVSG